MANNHEKIDSNDNSAMDSESSPLLEKQVVEEAKNENKLNVDSNLPAEKSEFLAPEFGVYNLTANGLPLSQGSVMGEPMGEPMGRTQWDSSLCDCFGRNDEFCSSDLEVCLLGSMAPCVLYGSNMERLKSAPGAFANSCVLYTGLYMIGIVLFCWNFLAPSFSYTSRTDIRRKFNLEGSFEALTRSCGCGGSCVEDDLQREQCELACDFANHFFCHTCALCQEARELRRRLPHPGFNAQPVLVMIPPGEQTMARGV